MMDPESQLSFKIYLDLGTDSKPEVRRFGIPQCNVTNYLFLKDKIRMMFPPLRNSTSNFKVSWKDDDGDLIDITSDEELLIALTEMSSQEIRKLFVSVLPHSVDENQVPRGSASTGNGAHHAGVVCDNCAGPVHGYRYKCIQCPDFDLCAACEMQGAHTDHFMIRLSNPISLRSHFTKGLAHRLAKARKHERRDGGRGSFRHCRFEEDGPRERRTGEGCPANTWISNFLAQLSEMGGATGAGFSETPGHGSQQEPQQHQQTFQQQQQQQPNQQQQQQQQQQSQQSQTGRQYQEFPNCTAISELVNGIVDTCLTNVGPIVEKIVDPMMFNGQLPREKVPPSQTFPTSEKSSGEKAKEKSAEFVEPVIDLEVRFGDEVISVSSDSFKTCEKSKGTPSESSNQMDRSDSVCSDKEMRPADDGKTQDKATATQPAPVQDAPPSIPRDQSMEVDGWTVLTSNVPENAATGGQSMESSSSATSQSSSAASQSSVAANQPQVVPVSAPVENLYPSLSSEMRSKNPKVNESLDKMLSMGFSNNGGWLLKLLEQCNGEIEMVCQMLEPVPKQNQ